MVAPASHPPGVASLDLERVLGWFAEGTLIRPGRSGHPDLVDLIRVLARSCGVEDLELTGHGRGLAERIGEHRHLVFVLIDGLGCELLRHLAGEGAGFLHGLGGERIEAVFPSTTAVALTSLATADHPARHGIPGWWSYLPEFGVTAEVLPFIERFSRRSLGELGARSQDVLTVPSIFPRFTRDQLVVTRGYIAGSTYSRYWSGGCPSVGYERISDAIDLVSGRVRAANAPTYTHLYLNQLDTVCHEVGIDHERTRATFAEIDQQMQRLHRQLAGHARVVITADHGHINAGIGCDLRHDHPLMDHLACPPSGEVRSPLFHVRDGRHEAFRAAFAEAYGEWFALLTLDEVESLQLLGPGQLSGMARRRFGDYIGVAPVASTFHYLHPGHRPARKPGVHAGLTPAEMMVPLITW